jgi:hypothetical protein
LPGEIFPNTILPNDFGSNRESASIFLSHFARQFRLSLMDGLDARRPTMSPSSAGLERRVWARHASQRQTLCLSETDTEEILWAGRIQDISREGVRLKIKRQFEPGTVLRLEVSINPEQTPMLLLAKVIHVMPNPDGSYALGCSLASPLSEEDLSRMIEPNSSTTGEPR